MSHKVFVGRGPGPIDARAAEEDWNRQALACWSTPRPTCGSTHQARKMLELHDKSKVEIFAYYRGYPCSGDATHERIRTAVDQWRDVGRLSDLQAAQKIVDDAIDFLVDLNGYQKHARTNTFAYRPAPAYRELVRLSGHHGKPLSSYHLIADRHILPLKNKLFYSEWILRIPCKQKIDRKREISAFRPNPAPRLGLPANAFVYASLNGMKKLTANCFARG